MSTSESPPVNVYEGAGQLTVAIPVPGAHHDTVEVSLRERTLSVQAEARYPQEQQHYLRHEWHVGRSHREVKLPKPVMASRAKAILTHGILTVSMPIGEERRSGPVSIPVVETSPHVGQ